VVRAAGAEARSWRRTGSEAGGTGEREVEDRRDGRARGGGHASVRWWRTTSATGGRSQRKTKEGVTRFPIARPVGP
jgi:hypothetical protein